MALNLSQLDGASGFRLDGIDAGDRSGGSGAGDVNGDGIDDLVIGAREADPGGGYNAGETHVAFGSTRLGGTNDARSAFDDAVRVTSFAVVDLAGDNGAGADRDPDLDDLTITAINGTPVTPGDSVVLASGLRVTVLDAAAVRFDAPSVTLGAFVSDSFTYAISDGLGEVDTATASVDYVQNTLALAALDGTTGFRVGGAGDESGFSVAGAGDVNGDGIDDIIIGAPGYGIRRLGGECYVVFGSTAGSGASLDLNALDGSNGFRLGGIASGNYTGWSVAGAGDVNGDGIDDLIIGAPGAHGFDGESYIVYGASAGFAASLDLSALDGTTGFSLGGVYGASGASVAGAGDVNGDCIDDVVVGAPDAGVPTRYDVGASFVIFGSATHLGVSLDLSTLDGTNGFRLDGIDAGDFSGVSVGGAGDINGDGIDDLIIGADGANPGGGERAGESYVVFGSTAGFAASPNLVELDGANGFRLDGIDAGDFSGVSVAGAGDINGDGIDDLIIGANGADPGGREGAGESYVVFGSTAGFAASLNLVELDGANGFRLDGIEASDGSAVSVAGAGDVNGDGIDDLIIGADGANPGGGERAGESYVVFGSTAGFAASLDLAALNGTNGYRLVGVDPYDMSGVSVAAAGDVNGDGIDDLIIGAQQADGGTGETYVVFGFRTGLSQTPVIGGPGRDILAGTAASEAFHPGGGFDFVTSGGGADTVFFNNLAGQRDVLTVADFDPLNDTLDLLGAEVAATFISGDQTVLQLEGPDRDMVVLLGISESPFDFLT